MLYPAAVAVASAAILAYVLIRCLKGGYSTDGLPLGADFTSFWAVSRLLWAGLVQYAYNPALHRLAEAPALPAGQYEAFFYPPPYLVICAPLGVLPFFWSFAAFMAATGTAFLAAIRQASASAWAIIAALGYAAVDVNFLGGQNGMLTAAIIGAGLTLMDRRPKLAGAILGLIVIKPHLALMIPVALVMSRRWTVLASAALSACALSVLAGLLFGWDVWEHFAAGSGAARHALEYGQVAFSKFQSVFAVVRAAGGGVALAYALQALSACVGFLLVAAARARGASFAMERSAIVVGCLLATPFVLTYDLVVLVFPFVWLASEWSEAGTVPLIGAAIVMVLMLLPFVVMAPSVSHLCVLGIFGLFAYLAACLARRGYV